MSGTHIKTSIYGREEDDALATQPHLPLLHTGVVPSVQQTLFDPHEEFSTIEYLLRNIRFLD